MIFGELSIDRAVGAYLAHSLRLPDRVLKKGRHLTSADIEAARAAGLTSVVAARLQDGDVHEDEAAQRCGEAMTGPHLRASPAATGRVNLYATAPGLLAIDRNWIERINGIDEAITVATLPGMAAVAVDQMVATIKIIPLSAPEHSVQGVELITREALAPLQIVPFVPKRIALIQTELSGTSPKMLDKTAAVTGARAAALQCQTFEEHRCPHGVDPLREAIGESIEAGAEIVLIAGASAIVDRRDVVPAAIEAAGGTIRHFGMPVDPGNLLLLAQLEDVPVIGLPGCARSPKQNGFDWILQRLVADVPVLRTDIVGMGLGGLLTEIPTRPLPRDQAAETAIDPDDAAAGTEAVTPSHAPRVAAIVLAAGQSRRMGKTNKLLADVDGTPMIVRSVDAVLASDAGPVIVVTGHEPDRIAAALADRDVTLIHNAAYGDGLSTSLKAGLVAIPVDADAALVCLGDMPAITAAHIDTLIAAYAPPEGRSIIVPTWNGKRGNPVLWGRSFISEINQISGDVGARHLIGLNEECVAEIAMDDDAVLIDVDTPDALRRALDRTGGSP